MDSEQAQTIECDVLVVGSGGGALTAALVAATQGLSVVVAEASEYFGGTTAYSGGGMWLPCNAVLRRAGDDDTLEDARTYFRSVVGDRTSQVLQDAFLDNGAPLIDALEKHEELAFRVLPWPDYYGAAPQARASGRHIVPKPLKPAELAELGELRGVVRPPLATERRGEALPETVSGGQALIARLLLALSRQPEVRLLTESPVDELLTEDGAVVGGVLAQAGARLSVHARRGVLLAAGGFERNQELRDRFGVPGEARDTMGAPANTGLALEAALRVGASTDLMDQAWWSPGITHADGTSTFSLWMTGGIFVDGDGHRFTNESWPYDRIGRDVIRRMDEGAMKLPFWMIYDDRDGGVPPVRATSLPVTDEDALREAGLRHTASTVAELAERIGVPAEELEATVSRFNELARAGTDEDFGRGSEPYDRAFSGGASPMVPLEQGPFHAAAFGLSDLGTKGGLRTDAAARVLDESGTPIRGLYAAGNSMAAVSGTTYPGGGNPIGACMVFGYLAALDMSQTENETEENEQ